MDENKYKESSMKNIGDIIEGEYGDIPKGAVHLSDFMSKKFPPTSWLVDQLFEVGTINMISAAPNNWKTWLTLDIAIAIAQGREAFGKFKTKSTGVLIVNEDDTDRNLFARLLKLGVGSGTDIPIWLRVDEGLLLTDNTVDVLLREMREKQLGLLILDCFSALHDVNENDASEVNKIVRRIRKLTRHGITVLFTHHHRKTGKNGAVSIPSEEIRGSTAIFAALSGHISCYEIQNEAEHLIVLTQHKSKAGAKLDHPFGVSIVFDEEKLKLEYAGSFEGRKGGSTYKSKVSKHLKDVGNWNSIQELMVAIGGAENSIRNAVRLLKGDGFIEEKTRKELVGQGALTNESNKQANEKFYKWRNG